MEDVGLEAQLASLEEEMGLGGVVQGGDNVIDESGITS